MVKEGRALNRVLRITEDGWEYEPDQRHAELIIEDMHLKDANSVTTPGEEEKTWEKEENEKEVNKENGSKYRKIAARANYLAADRPDIMYAVKEICRWMAKPTVGGWKSLKRLARYLKGKRRVVIRYPWQGKQYEVEAFPTVIGLAASRQGSRPAEVSLWLENIS